VISHTFTHQQLLHVHINVFSAGPVAAYAAEFASDEVWPVLLADGEPLSATPGTFRHYALYITSQRNELRANGDQ
jgi:hypothetical protein